MMYIPVPCTNDDCDEESALISTAEEFDGLKLGVLVGLKFEIAVGSIETIVGENDESVR